MTASRVLPLLGLLAAVLAGVARAQSVPRLAAAGDDRAPSHAVFPTQSLPLRFNHAQHLSQPGTPCERCHPAARASDRAQDSLLPTEAVCRPCHPIDRAQAGRAGTQAARCERCHEGWEATQPLRVARAQVPAPNIRFSHRVHLQRGAACTSCHGSLRDVALATRLELPRMSLCLGCHRAGGAPSNCATCHPTEQDGTLITHFAEGWLNPPEWMRGLHHDADFWVEHRSAAAQDGSRCAPCHRDEDCESCHDGRVRDRRNHPNDYATLHVLDARMNSDRCGSCHRLATFCARCHERAGVAETSSPATRPFGRIHPPAAVWVNPPVSSRHHGIEARRSLSACVSCHTEQDCATCHATLGRGAGFSPHPPGFASRCAALLRASDRSCRFCHVDFAEIEARCR